jgi:hypothetical protein
VRVLPERRLATLIASSTQRPQTSLTESAPGLFQGLQSCQAASCRVAREEIPKQCESDERQDRRRRKGARSDGLLHVQPGSPAPAPVIGTRHSESRVNRHLPWIAWLAGLPDCGPPGGSRVPVIGAKALTAALKEQPFPHMAHRACKPAGVRQRTGLLLFRYPCAHSPDIECQGAWD